MTDKSNQRMIAQINTGGHFGHQPVEQRGYQPILAAPADISVNGYQPTVSQSSAPTPTPPSQGSSGKK